MPNKIRNLRPTLKETTSSPSKISFSSKSSTRTKKWSCSPPTSTPPREIPKQLLSCFMDSTPTSDTEHILPINSLTINYRQLALITGVLESQKELLVLLRICILTLTTAINFYIKFDNSIPTNLNLLLDSPWEDLQAIISHQCIQIGSKELF